MKKLCYTCKQLKPLDAFNKNKGRKDGLNSICRDCSKARSKQYYKENPDKHKKNVVHRNREYRNILRSKMLEYLATHPCVDCDNRDVRVLEFDHLRDKAMNVVDMISKVYSWGAIMKEIDKCEVVCSNCHKIRTAERSNNYKHVAFMGV